MVLDIGADVLGLVEEAVDLGLDAADRLSRQVAACFVSDAPRGFLAAGGDGALDAPDREQKTGEGLSGAADGMGHGEGFPLAFRERFQEPGRYVLDEPEAALSFASCLQLVWLPHELGRSGAQIIRATHSPALAALPGAEAIEVGDHGMRPAGWRDLELVDHWRRYLNDPWACLRHIVDAR